MGVAASYAFERARDWTTSLASTDATATTVDVSAIVPELAADDAREEHWAVATGSVDTPMTEEEKQCRGLATLQAVAVSGFLESVANIEASCLSVCNICRDAVPVQRLRICRGVPPSMQAMAYPSCPQPENQILSRIFPHHTVPKVHWKLRDSPGLSRFLAIKEKMHAETRATDFEIGQAVDISKIQWPEGTSEIALCSCNRRINGVTWPIGLKILWFGQPTVPASIVYRLSDVFNTPLNGVQFPGVLREIFLGDSFNQPIEGIAWPGGLERLSLPGFNQSIRNVQWRSGLKTLEFVSPPKLILWDKDGEEFFSGVYPGFRQYQQGIGCFNQPLGTTLPPSLKRFWLSSAFTQRLDNVVWPIGIVTLGLAFDLDSYLFGDSITWPPQLCVLFVVDDGEISYPRGRNVTTLPSRFDRGYFRDLYDY